MKFYLVYINRNNFNNVYSLRVVERRRKFAMHEVRYWRAEGIDVVILEKTVSFPLTVHISKSKAGKQIKRFNICRKCGKNTRFKYGRCKKCLGLREKERKHE